MPFLPSNFDVCLLLLTLSSAAAVPIANTQYGRIRGSVEESLKGKPFLAFRGVPFASPPIGPLRLKEPQSPSKHEEILDTTKDSEDCLQPDVHFNSYPIDPKNFGKLVGTEDCLYLNVYTPSLHPDKLLPVMFYIHGGGFMYGSGSSNLFGPEILLNEDIVLVTTNYRLGPLGFLSFEDEVLPGNLGLKDQAAALEWVNKNIDNFGGDPSSVTIFGESAGASSVHFQMMSSKSRGLFHRAISQSGNMNCPWTLASPGQSKAAAFQLAEILSCPKDPRELIKCLQEKTVEEIFNASSVLKGGPLPLSITFRPVIEEDIDGAFISVNSIRNAPPIPWLTGVNSKEGSLAYNQLIIAGDRSLEKLNKHYKTLIPSILIFGAVDISSEIDSEVDKIKEFYLGEKPFSEDNLEEVINMFSDSHFLYPHSVAVKNHKGNLFLYYYTHKGERSFSNIYGNDHIEGANHGDDNVNLFFMKKFFPNKVYNDVDSKISDLWVHYWTSFAIHGKPTTQYDSVQWEESGDDQQFLEISAEGVKMQSNFFPKRMRFWDSIKFLQMKSSQEQIRHSEL